MASSDREALEKSVQKSQKQIMDGVKASQEWMLESIQAANKAALESGQPTPPPPASQLSEGDVRKMVDDAFDFTATLLNNQREFTHQLMQASVNAGSDKKKPSGS